MFPRSKHILHLIQSALDAAKDLFILVGTASDTSADRFIRRREHEIVSIDGALPTSEVSFGRVPGVVEAAVDGSRRGQRTVGQGRWRLPLSLLLWFRRSVAIFLVVIRLIQLLLLFLLIRDGIALRGPVFGAAFERVVIIVASTLWSLFFGGGIAIATNGTG